MHCKSSFGSFSDSPRHPRAMKPFQWVVVFFLAHLSQRSWSDIVSPAQKHFHSSLLTPPQASRSTNVVQEQPIEITPNFTTHQTCNHPKLPRRMGISSLDVLLHWRKKILGGFLLQAFVFLEQSLQNSKLKVFVDLMDHRKMAADSPFQIHSTCP